MLDGFVEFLKGEKSFYKYTKQTILHLSYRVFVLSISFDVLLLVLYSTIRENRVDLITKLIYISCSATLFVLVFILFVNIYFIFIKKDISPLQSEQHQIAKELITKIQGDSNSGLSIVDGLKSIYLEGGEKQNSKKE
ncbi:MAG: hypothetical protein ACHQD8_05695 [Chitinophagales bacterium]